MTRNKRKRITKDNITKIRTKSIKIKKEKRLKTIKLENIPDNKKQSIHEITDELSNILILKLNRLNSIIQPTYNNPNQFLNYYMENISKINVKDFVLINDSQQTFWVEVFLTEDFIDSNKDLHPSDKLLSGKISNCLRISRSYDYGSLIYFKRSSVLDKKTFSELLDMYMKK